MASSSVVLIGFSGSGKSETARHLAALLDYDVADTDSMVEATAGASVSEIFASEGEKAFRARESDAVAHATSLGGRVIACGGGAVLSLANYSRLREAGPIVYLRTRAATVLSRIQDASDRPLLRGDAKANVATLLAERAPAYEAAADFVVDTDDRTPEEVAAEIARLVKGPA